MPVGYLSGGFLMCRGRYSSSFLPALFQFGGKEVLEWAIPAVLEQHSAPRVSNGERGVLPLGKHGEAGPGRRGAFGPGSLLLEPSRVGHGNVRMREHWVVAKMAGRGHGLPGDRTRPARGCLPSAVPMLVALVQGPGCDAEIVLWIRDPWKRGRLHPTLPFFFSPFFSFKPTSEAW